MLGNFNKILRKFFTTNDVTREQREKLKQQIQSDNANTFDECVKSYLKLFGNEPIFSDAFQNFIAVISEKGLYEKEKIDQLRYELQSEQFKSQIAHVEPKKDDFLKSSQYIFIQKAVEELKHGKDVDYSALKSQIGSEWNLSTNQISKFISIEMERQNVSNDVNASKADQIKAHHIKAIQRTIIIEFVKKHGARASHSHYFNLRKRLSNAKIQISYDELKKLVLEEEEVIRRRKEREEQIRLDVKRKKDIYLFILEFVSKHKFKTTSDDHLRLKEMLANESYEVSLEELTNSVIEVENSKRREEANKQAKIIAEQKLKEQKIAEQKLEEQKGVRQRLAEQKLAESQSLITTFTKKIGLKATKKDYENLQAALANREFNVSLSDLINSVNKENKKQQTENLKSKIFAQSPHNRAAILKYYLDYHQSDDDANLELLREVLEERYSSPENTVSLKTEIKAIEKRIEIERFEKRLFEEDEQIRLETVDQFNGYEFEDFLKQLFSKMGYRVEQTKLSGDQGADLVVIRFNEKTVIQAKRFSGKVGNFAVQEIMAAISLYQAQKGMVVTNNYFTPAAVELANANNIELVDRTALEHLINKHW